MRSDALQELRALNKKNINSLEKFKTAPEEKKRVCPTLSTLNA